MMDYIAARIDKYTNAVLDAAIVNFKGEESVMGLHNFKQQLKDNKMIYGLWSLARDRLHPPIEWKMQDGSQYIDNVRRAFYREYKYKLDLVDPKTFSEKLQWLKVYDNTPIKTTLSDKYAVREWVKERVGEKYLINLLGVYDSFGEIDFDKLPDKFVIKANHGCGYNILVKDKNKLDKCEACKRVTEWLDTDFSALYGELQYKNIERRIIIEEYIDFDRAIAPPDYKFFCFNGKPYYIMYCFDRFIEDEPKNTFYDLNWNNMKFSYFGTQYNGDDIPAPLNFAEMISITEGLCKDFKHVRVDLYNVNGKIYFGEMTFTSFGGKFHFNPPEWDRKLGDLLNLN